VDVSKKKKKSRFIDGEVRFIEGEAKLSVMA
jgi:hypothetical protein